MSILSNEARARVESAVRRAEEGTSGEVVVAVAPLSDNYALIRFLVGGALTIALCVEAVPLLGDAPMSLLFAAQLPLIAFLYWCAGLSSLLRFLVPKPLRKEAVRRRALAAFVELGVVETEARSGVLIFISERERAVELIADRGIHERVPADYFQGVVESLTRSLRAGEAEAGLIELIGRLSELLSKEFPPSGENRNELPNEVRSV